MRASSVARLTLLISAFFVLGCSTSAQPLAPIENPNLHKVASAYPDFSGHILVANETSIVFNKVYGKSQSGAEIAYHERWRWASVTKQIVAIAVMQLIEEGHLSLSSKVADVLPTAGVPNAEKISIRDLLQHTSGLANDADLPDESFINGFDARSYCRGAAKRDPGEAFEYNNCDYIILGQIIEAVDNVPWFESLDKRIFSPLGAESIRSGSKNNGGETVLGFASHDTPAPGVALELYEASGGLVGVVGDLLKIDRALLAGALLQNESRAEMWRSNPAYGFAALGQWVFPGELRGCDAPVTIVERRGAISGIQVLNILIPERRLSVISFVNRDDFDWGAVWARHGFAYDLLSAAICN